MTPIESLAARTLLWATTGGAVAVPALLVPAVSDPVLPGVIHLVLLAIFAMGLTFHLAPLAEPAWFGGTDLGEAGRVALTRIVVVAAVSAAVAAATVPTAVALRYDASMQFFVLLVAVAIAGHTAAVVLGVRSRFGAGAASIAGAVPGLVASGMFWRYLDLVGTGPGGSWVVDGSRIGTLVLPVTAAISILAWTAFSLGVRRR